MSRLKTGYTTLTANHGIVKVIGEVREGWYKVIFHRTGNIQRASHESLIDRTIKDIKALPNREVETVRERIYKPEPEPIKVEVYKPEVSSYVSDKVNEFEELKNKYPDASMSRLHLIRSIAEGSRIKDKPSGGNEKSSGFNYSTRDSEEHHIRINKNNQSVVYVTTYTNPILTMRDIDALSHATTMGDLFGNGNGSHALTSTGLY